MAFPAPTRLHCRLVAKIGVVAALVFVSSYCTTRGNHTENVQLTNDEIYLVESYVGIAEARDLRPASRAKSESLFVALDSTIDTTRISNTIRELNADPDRWLAVYRAIDKAMTAGIGESPSKENR
jgi:hypothetical protein